MYGLVWEGAVDVYETLDESTNKTLRRNTAIPPPPNTPGQASLASELQDAYQLHNLFER
jgi:hypothetical protein